MTKENLTSINVIIDQSGSMGHLTKDTIGGFNKFLAEQKDVPGEALFTLCLFATDYRLVHDCVKIGDVPELNERTYRPGGGTALLDALGTTIDEVGKKLATLADDERPSKVIFLIITDGEENMSKVYHEQNRIKDMVTHQREKYNWEFVFMGANIDAISAGTNLGISMNNTMNYNATAAGTKGLYQNVSDSLRSYRGSSAGPQVDFFNQPLDLTNKGTGGNNSGTP